MMFQVFSFTVRIERNSPTPEQRWSQYRQEQWLRAREEAHAVEAAQLGWW